MHDEVLSYVKSQLKSSDTQENIEGLQQKLKSKLLRLKIRNTEARNEASDQAAQHDLFIEQNQLIYELTSLFLKGVVPQKVWFDAKDFFGMNALSVSPQIVKKYQ